MAAHKENLPKPVYSTDFYLAAVLVELRKMNSLLEQLAIKRNTAANETVKKK